MTNSPQMTLEERITQTIKSDTLMALVGNEDAITELVKKAIYEALFQPRKVLKPYGGYEEKDSPIVEAARVVAKKVTNKIVQDLLEDQVVRQKIKVAALAIIPSVLTGAIHSGLISEIDMTARQAIMDFSAQDT